MTIECKEIRGGRIKKVTYLMPGTEETLSDRIFGIEEVWLHVDSDDAISITYVDVDRSLDIPVRKFREKVTLSKHDINNHTVRSDPSFLRRTVKEYGWVPSRLHIDPEDEATIQQLIKSGTYTEQDASEVRDQLLFEKQREIRGRDNNGRKALNK